jgi:plasmid stabilization system protein ParE
MTTPSTPTKTTTNLDDAIATYSNAAYDKFYAAETKIAAANTPEAADAAQRELTSAFTQLSAAAQIQAEQRDRAGFGAVVDLMETTTDAAANISAKLVTLLHADPGDPGRPPAADYQLIDELKTTLDVLARLSPSAVFTSSGDSTKSG